MIVRFSPEGKPLAENGEELHPEWIPVGPEQVPTGWLWFGGYVLAETASGPRFLFDAEAAKWLVKAYRYAFEEPEVEFQSVEAELNGGFALAYSANHVAQTPAPSIHLLADRCGGRALFMLAKNNQLFLATDALELGKYAATGLNRAAGLSLLAGEWVPGTETLASDVTQLKPGEWLQYTPQGKLHRRTLTWQPNVQTGTSCDQTEAASAMLEALESMADRWSAALLALLSPGEKIGIPLSGGLDSRVLLGLFAPRLQSRLVALCYGNPKSEDVRLSREAARRIGVEHRLVEFTDASFLSQERQTLLAKTIGTTTRLTLGDGGLALAEAYGKGSGARGADVAVVLPGHSGDCVTGSRLSKQRSAQPTLEIQDYFTRTYHSVFTASDFAQFLQPEHLRLAAAPSELWNATFAPLQGDSPSAFILRWMINEIVHRRVLTELPLYHSKCRALLPFFDYSFLDALGTLPEAALWGQTAYKAAAIKLFSTPALKPLLNLPLQMRPPLVGKALPAPARRLLYGLQRRINPLAFERHYSSCPMMSLWVQTPELRNSTLKALQQSPTIQSFFRLDHLNDHLRKHLGSNWQLTTIGIWTLTTLAIVGDELEA